MGLFRPNLRQEVMGTEEDVQVYVDSVIQSKANPKNLEEIKQATQADSEMQVLVQLIEQGWPKYKIRQERCKSSMGVHDKLSVAEGLVVLESQIVIPKSMRKCHP